MGLFMLFIISMAAYMIMQPADNYDTAYYEKGLNYDDDYQKKQNVLHDNAQPQVTAASGTVDIAFAGRATGTVLFSRPSDKKMDRLYQVKQQQAVSITNLPRGKWDVTFTWTHNNTAYLYRQDIYIE